MNQRSSATIRALSLLIVPVLAVIAGCPLAPNGTSRIVPPSAPTDGGPVTDPGVIAAFDAFLSADRTQLIRGDASEGNATITIRTSLCADFEWTICVQTADGECSEALARQLLEIVFPADNAPPATESVITARVIGDPGPNGTDLLVRVTANVSEEPGDDCPDAGAGRITGTESETIEAELRVLRPRGALAVTLSSPDGSSVQPGGVIGLMARISGGRPFSPGTTPDCSNGGFSPPNNGDPYCVNWIVNETLLDAGGQSVSGDFDLDAIFASDGDNISEGDYTAPIATGTVLFTVEVTDETGNTVTSTVPISVDSARALAILDAQADSTQLEPDSSTVITASGQGGTPPYQIAITQDNASLGTLSSDGCDDLDSEEQCQVTYTASPTEVGSDIVTIRLTDAVGASDTFAIPINVASAQTLAVNATAGTTSLFLNQSTPISAVVSGGTAPYNVCFKVDRAPNLGQPGGTSFESGSDCAGLTDFSNCSCNQTPTGTDTTTIVRRQLTAGGIASQGTVNISVKVVDAVGAEALGFVSLDISQSAGSGTITADPPTASKQCIESDGTDTVDLSGSATGGSGDFSFGWSAPCGTFPGGSTGPNVTWQPEPSCPDSVDVSVTVTDNLIPTLPPGTNSINLGVIAAAEASASQSDICEDATVDLIGGPDNPTATFAWDCGGGITFNVQNPTGVSLPAGDVTCTLVVTTSPVCSAQDTVMITVNALPDSAIQLPPGVTSACANSDNNTVSVADAGANATYDWTVTGGTRTDGGGNTSNTIEFSAGTGPSVDIDVTVTDANTCTSSSMLSIPVIANHTATAANDGPVCAADAAGIPNLVTLTAGPAPGPLNLTYDWNCDNGFTSSQRIPPATAFPVGDTVCTITVTNVDTTCFDTETTTITVHPVPSADITAAAEVCAGSLNNVASVPDAGPGATYAWTVTGGTLTGGANTNSIEYTAGAGPDVVIDVTVTNADGCPTDGTTTVLVNDNPVGVASNDGPICDGESVTISALPDLIGATYDWTCDDGSTHVGRSVTFTPNPAGPFPADVFCSVAITDPNNCVNQTPIQTVITVNGLPDATISAEASVCENTAGHIASVPDAGFGTTYAWTITGAVRTDGGGNTANSITYTAGTSPGDVTIEVTVTDANGCASSSGLTTIPIHPTPVALITADADVCEGSTGNTASVADAGPGATYDWTVTGGTRTDGGGTTATSITYTAGAGPNLTIDVTITDANGCTASDTAMVLVNDAPDATITADAEVCEDATGLVASVPDAGPGATYDWAVIGGTRTDGGGDATNSITYTAGAGPTVIIQVSVNQAGNMCPGLGMAMVTVHPLPTVTASGPTDSCRGETVTLTAEPDIAGATYVWTCDDVAMTTASGRVVMITPDIGILIPPTVISCEVVVTDANGCTATDTAVFTVNDAPDATITTPATACEGSTGNMASVPAAGMAATYDWQITNGTITAGNGTPMIEFTAGTLPDPTVLSVTVTDNGCPSMDSVNVALDPAPGALASNDGPACVGTMVTLTGGPIDPTFTYEWNCSDGFTASTRIASYAPAASGMINCTLTVTDTLNGCSSEDTTVVDVVDPDTALDPVTPVEACLAGQPGCVTDPFCSGDTIDLVPNDTIQPGVTPEYTWVCDGGLSVSDPAIRRPSVTPTCGAGSSCNFTCTVTVSSGPADPCPAVGMVTFQVDGDGIGGCPTP